jgi:hypothetical protein
MQCYPLTSILLAAFSQFILAAFENKKTTSPTLMHPWMLTTL